MKSNFDYASSLKRVHFQLRPLNYFFSRRFPAENVKRFTTRYRLLTFKLSSIPSSEKLVTAEVRIFARRSQPSVQTTKRKPPGVFKISLYQLGRRWKKDGKWKRKSVVAALKVTKARRYGEWISFNVTETLIFWQKYPRKNHGFWIDVKAHNARASDFRIATGGRKEPILVTFGVDRSKLKQLRQVMNNSVKDKPINYPKKNVKIAKSQKRTRNKRSYSNSCQRHKLFVEFRDLKWENFIIAPKGFSAYYCKGKCPEVIDQSLNPTNHAIIQSLVHHRHDRNIPTACCVPTKLNSISLLYFERDGSIVLKEYAEMVASTCGCR